MANVGAEVWVSVAEAARRTRWNPKTIRARCRRGDIPHQRIGNGPIRVATRWVEQVEAAAAARAEAILAQTPPVPAPDTMKRMRNIQLANEALARARAKKN